MYDNYNEVDNMKRKIYYSTKNTYFTLINESKLKEIMIYNNKVVLNVLIDNNFNKHLILSKDIIKKKNNIYFESLELKKNNNKSKDFKLLFKLVISSLFNLDNLLCSLDLIVIDNIKCYEVFFN